MTKKLLLTAITLVVILMVFLARAARTSFGGGRHINGISRQADLVYEQCIRVAAFVHPNTIFIPVVSGGTGLPWTGPVIREVSEDSGGCLVLVGDEVHLTLEASEGDGTATVDVGTIHTGIRLYDDGSHGDSNPGDGSYERS